jgi:glycerate kinase
MMIPPKIVIAPDSFKECLTAKKVADHIALGIKRASPSAIITCIPFADGGEGTVDALVYATQGEVITVNSMDPLMREIPSFYGVLGDKKTAVIEMAAASGIGLLTKAERNPMVASSYGTGLLIREVLDKGYTDIIIGIGGSATNDGGMGMATALGYRFLDRQGIELPAGGGGIDKLHTIDDSGVHPLLAQAKITVACDVTNPLTGPSGASAIYGPQKGADKAMVNRLDRNLKHFAGMVKQKYGKDISEIPGAGAAGGLGAGLIAFTKAELMPGFEIIRRTTNLDARIAACDMVFSAEGKIDYQTQFGKTPFGVAQIAAKYSKPALVLAGSIGEGADVLLKHGVTAYFCIADRPMSLDESMASAGRLIEETSEQIMRTFCANR